MTAARIPVFEAGIGVLHQAQALLASHGIVSRHTRPRRAKGLLKVSRTDAERARELLREAFGERGRVMEASESELFVCDECGESLSAGAPTCASCGAVVGDPHGR